MRQPPGVNPRRLLLLFYKEPAAQCGDGKFLAVLKTKWIKSIKTIDFYIALRYNKSIEGAIDRTEA